MKLTEEQLLLIILAEECNEVAQRVSKALRFGLNEIQDGQPFTNMERIALEFNDLIGVINMLSEKGIIHADQLMRRDHIEAKIKKVEKYLNHSEFCGVLQDMANEKKTQLTLKFFLDNGFEHQAYNEAYPTTLVLRNNSWFIFYNEKEHTVWMNFGNQIKFDGKCFTTEQMQNIFTMVGYADPNVYMCKECRNVPVAKAGMVCSECEFQREQ